MATVTGLTAERMLEIEAASVVEGEIRGGDLFSPNTMEQRSMLVP